MPEVVMQRVLQIGIESLRNDKLAFYELFDQFSEPEIETGYGESYVDGMWTWFSDTKIPIVQAWGFNVDRIPCVSVHLAIETEDEQKAAVGDYFGNLETEDDPDGSEIKVGVFTVNLDFGIHASKDKNEVLWLFYIIKEILFKHKILAEKLGVQLHTFSASDYNKESKYMADNIWTRWIRFRCTTQDTFRGDRLKKIDDAILEVQVSSSSDEEGEVTVDMGAARADP
jgi:hypothetical protein